MAVENSTTYTPTVYQSGHSVGTSTFTTGGSRLWGVAPLFDAHIGVIFDLSSAFGLDAASRALDPPRLYGTVSLTMQRLTGTPNTGTMKVYMVNDPTPADYSVSLLPLTRGETDDSDYLLHTEALTATTDAQTVTFDIGRLLPVVSQATWVGKFALTLTYSAVNTGTWADPSITVTGVPAHTGWLGLNPGDVRTRGVRDGRFGMPCLSADLVQDGNLDGVWVLPEHRDPFDEGRETTYVPRPTEGAGDPDGKPR